MDDPDHDRPFGDDGFTDPRRKGPIATVFTAILRAVIGVVGGSEGRQWPWQLPLDQPDRNRDYRP